MMMLDEKQGLKGDLSRWFRYRPLPLWAVALSDRLQRLSHSGKQYPMAARPEHLSCQPLFIVSAGRSGTTLLRSMLVAGSDIAIPQENHSFPVAIRRFRTLQKLGWPDLSRLIVSLFASHYLYPHWDVNPALLLHQAIKLPDGERSLARLIDLVFQQYQEAHFPEAKLWGDQSPLNALYLHWLLPVFPQARYLHLLRDGRDVVASMVHAQVGAGSLADACLRWQTSVKQAHWLVGKVPADNYLELRYEDLVQAPEASLQRVADLCQIDYSEKMLDYWKMPTTVEHKVFDHHRNLSRPPFGDSIGRWRERLDANQQAYVLKQLGATLSACDYSD